MAYFFDTNAISETVRRQPNAEFINWLINVPRSEQFTSIVVAAELYAGAYGSDSPEKWLKRLESDLLPRLTILDFDMGCAHIYGQLRCALRRQGQPIGDVDTQIAATSLRNNLTLVTANTRHFKRIPGLRLKEFTPKGNV
ncbi:PIN domain-containing protein [bacterium]|nr:PIN domain-containing protein [bacterium]